MDVFRDFKPKSGVPLLISFSNHLSDAGYTTAIEFDFWDMYAFKDSDEPEFAVLTVKQALTAHQMTKVSRDQTPVKVILAEDLNLNHPRFYSMQPWLAFLGAGLYVRNVGWVVLPGNPQISISEDDLYRNLPRYRKTEDGTWLKKCSKCQNEYPPEQFYRRPQRTSKDPRRNLCKACFVAPS